MVHQDHLEDLQVHLLYLQLQLDRQVGQWTTSQDNLHILTLTIVFNIRILSTLEGHSGVIPVESLTSGIALERVLLTKSLLGISFREIAGITIPKTTDIVTHILTENHLEVIVRGIMIEKEIKRVEIIRDCFPRTKTLVVPQEVVHLHLHQHPLHLLCPQVLLDRTKRRQP